MSGVYIKGLGLPIDCYDCMVSSEFNLYDEHGNCECGMECPLLKRVIDDESKRLDDCPLVPVPDHGRLIDVNTLDPDTEWDDRSDGFISYSGLAIDAAPTIIPADKEAEA